MVRLWRIETTFGAKASHAICIPPEVLIVAFAKRCKQPSVQLQRKPRLSRNSVIALMEMLRDARMTGMQ